jgi:hypothetical protein
MVVIYAERKRLRVSVSSCDKEIMFKDSANLGIKAFRKGLGFSHLFHLVNQLASRTIMCLNGIIVGQFGNDIVGKAFPEFNTPLVETEDIPNDALYESSMLEKSCNGSEIIRRKLLIKQAYRRNISSKNAEWK